MTPLSGYFTSGRLRLLRLQAIMGCVNDIVRAFIRVCLETKLGASWDDGQLWREWSVANLAFLKGFPFWKLQAKETFRGHLVPIFEKCDIGFFYYASSQITEEREGIRVIKGDLLYLIAH